MKVVCPNCGFQQNTRPDELLGRCYVCRRCSRIYRWEGHSAKPQRREGGQRQRNGSVERGVGHPAKAEEREEAAPTNLGDFPLRGGNPPSE